MKILTAREEPDALPPGAKIKTTSSYTRAVIVLFYSVCNGSSLQDNAVAAVMFVQVDELNLNK